MARNRPNKLSDKNKTVDVLVYNDSTMLAIYSESAVKMAPSIRSQRDAVDRELGMAVPLCQDDSYVLRVRLGHPSAAEKREFVGVASGHLDLASGVLLSGESAVLVPKKRYRIEIRSFLPHSMACWQWAKANTRSEKLGSYFRRTRPGESFPEWLSEICWSHPADDPGHEKEWRGLNAVSAPQSAYVEFLVNLLPPSSRKPVSKISRNGTAEWEIRCPELCPKGIKAPGVPAEGMDDEDDEY